MDTEEHKKKTDIAICFGALNLQQKTNLEERDGKETKQKAIYILQDALHFFSQL